MFGVLLSFLINLPTFIVSNILTENTAFRMNAEELKSKWKKQVKKDTASKLKSLVSEVTVIFNHPPCPLLAIWYILFICYEVLTE